MMADNTCFSTGIYTRVGGYRAEINQLTGGIIKLHTNEAEGSFDPSLFFSNQYAVGVATQPTLMRSNLRYYKYRLGL